MKTFSVVLVVLCLIAAGTTALSASGREAVAPAAVAARAQQEADSNAQPERQAQEPDQEAGVEGNQIYLDEESAQRIGSILIVFLVLSVVFEMALTPIFKWSVFIEHFEGRGFKTPIVVLLALAVFWRFELDIFRDVLNAMTVDSNIEITWWGRILTALLIAGGSGSVYDIFKKLGIRNPEARREEVLGAPELTVVTTEGIQTTAATTVQRAVPAANR